MPSFRLPRINIQNDLSKAFSTPQSFQLRSPNGFGLEFAVGNLFLDFDRLQERLGSAKANALRRLGAQLRTSVARQVKRRGQVSKPNQSPTAWAAGNSGLKAVRFKLDDRTFTLVVGVLKYPSQTRTDRPAPNIHEFGGRVRVLGRRRLVRSTGPTQAVNQNNRNYGRDVVVDKKKGLLRSKRTGRYLTKAEADRRFKRYNRSTGQVTSNRNKAVRHYPKRPFVKPVLDRFTTSGRIIRGFKGILRG